MDPKSPGEVSEKEYPTSPVLVEGLSPQFMRYNLLVPLDRRDDELVVAMARPDDMDTLDAVRIATQLRVVARPGSEDDIADAVERLYGQGASAMERIVSQMGEEEAEEAGQDSVEHLRDMASEAPVIRLVNLIISKAVDMQASDIHLEPFESRFKIRYRIDGVLHEMESPPRRLQSAVISRLKIMSKLDIAERRLPQDGRIKMTVQGKPVDFRVSTIPTLFGESVVLRILDQGSVRLDLHQLGLPEDIKKDFDLLIRKPYGMVLVTGPTGSGKTTTLYGALEQINEPDKKIITVEDPVEYQMQGVNQIQVKSSIGLTFAKGLRSIVRQDPDVILVGEIRDAETAEIAIQSALTGHLVFSTLHTNDSAGAVARLLEMGIEDYLLSSCLLAVMAQRLVRVLCPLCKKRVRAEAGMLSSLNVEMDVNDLWVYEPAGCEECGHTGYRGRMGIYEYLKVTDRIRKLILDRGDSLTIKRAAVEQGMRTLRADGFERVLQGHTSFAELLRVTLEE